MLKGIDGVILCETDTEVNQWIASNPDKVVIDVKLTGAYNYHDEKPTYCCLILYQNKN